LIGTGSLAGKVPSRPWSSFRSVRDSDRTDPVADWVLGLDVIVGPASSFHVGGGYFVVGDEIGVAAAEAAGLVEVEVLLGHDDFFEFGLVGVVRVEVIVRLERVDGVLV